MTLILNVQLKGEIMAKHHSKHHEEHEHNSKHHKEHEHHEKKSHKGHEKMAMKAKVARHTHHKGK